MTGRPTSQRSLPAASRPALVLPSVRQLEYAVALAEHCHFGRAADSVNVSQPGLSSQIAELEERLGVVLFERSSRRVSVTPAGEEMIERARGILRDLAELAMAARLHEGTLRSKLVVAAIPTMAPYRFPDVVTTFRGQWPDVELRLQELPTAALVAAVETGAVDIGLLATPAATGTLHVESVATEAFSLVVPEKHQLSGHRGPLAVAALAELPVLVLEDGHCLRQHAQSVCDRVGAEAVEVGSAGLATLTQMVAAGLGVTLVPESALAVEARAGSGVSVVPLEDPAPGRGIAVAWRPTDPRSIQYAEVLPALRERLPSSTTGR